MPSPARTLLSTLLLGAAAGAWAGPQCTDRPEAEWLSPAQMDQRLKALGYVDDVRRLHVSKGRCWEIYGHNRSGQAVEVYFHPLSGAIVQETVKR